MSTSATDQASDALMRIWSAIAAARHAGHSRAEIDAIVDDAFTDLNLPPDDDLRMPEWLEGAGGSPDRPDGDLWTTHIFDTPEPEPAPEPASTTVPAPAPLRRLGRLPQPSTPQAAPAVTTSKPGNGLRRLPASKPTTQPEPAAVSTCVSKDSDDFLSCVEPECP